MSRLTSIVAVVLLSSGVVYGQGEVVSFFGGGVGAGFKLADLPQDGFVLTDVIITDSGGQPLTNFYEGTPAEGESKLQLENDIRLTHFQSGISFSGGSELWVQTVVAGSPITLTVCGYIPCSNPCDVPVPTVGEWGTMFMMMLILIGGTVVFARRFQNTSSVVEG